MQLQPTQTLGQVQEHISELPLAVRQDIFAYIDMMRLKYSQDNHAPIKKRTAGTLRGKVIFAADFDEPLDDFKEYM